MNSILTTNYIKKLPKHLQSSKFDFVGVKNALFKDIYLIFFNRSKSVAITENMQNTACHMTRNRDIEDIIVNYYYLKWNKTLGRGIN